MFDLVNDVGNCGCHAKNVSKSRSATSTVSRVRAESPNDPKLSDRGARRGLCAGEGGRGAKAEESIGRDVRSGSLQRMVRRCGPIGGSVE